MIARGQQNMIEAIGLINAFPGQLKGAEVTEFGDIAGDNQSVKLFL